MHERGWLTSTDPQAMMVFLRATGKASDRKWLHFIAACCRAHWGLLNESSRSALEAVERKADGRWTREEGFRAYEEAEVGFEQACEEVGYYDNPYVPESPPEIRWAGVVGGAVEEMPAEVASRAVAMAAGQNREWQVQLLRDLFGPLPFRPVTLPESVKTWNDSLIRRLAEQAYEHRTMPAGTLDPDRLAVLADALEEAGANAALVGHLRKPGSHWRGCHALDSILGRE